MALVAATRQSVVDMLDKTWEQTDKEAFALTEDLAQYGFTDGLGTVSVVLTVEVDGAKMRREATYPTGF